MTLLTDDALPAALGAPAGARFSTTDMFTELYRACIQQTSMMCIQLQLGTWTHLQVYVQAELHRANDCACSCFRKQSEGQGKQQKGTMCK